MSVDVRPARASDLPGVLEGYEWLFAPPGSRPEGWDPQRARGALDRLLAAADAELLVAVRGDAVLGLCSVYLDIDSVRFGLRAWVEDLAVDPGARSGGIGSRLLAAAKAWARKRGATHLELDSADARTDAHRFYRREGAASESRSFGWPL
jgi:GNAT superfamily N-acetyltransferase